MKLRIYSGRTQRPQIPKRPYTYGPIKHSERTIRSGRRNLCSSMRITDRTPGFLNVYRRISARMLAASEIFAVHFWTCIRLRIRYLKWIAQSDTLDVMRRPLTEQRTCENLKQWLDYSKTVYGSIILNDVINLTVKKQPSYVFYRNSKSLRMI